MRPPPRPPAGPPTRPHTHPSGRGRHENWYSLGRSVSKSLAPWKDHSWKPFCTVSRVVGSRCSGCVFHDASMRPDGSHASSVACECSHVANDFLLATS